MQQTRNRIVPSVMALILVGCATPTRIHTVHLTPHVDIHAITVTKSFEALKKDYSVQKSVSWGVDPELKKKSIKLAKVGINYEAPERKMTITASIWDLPLIKSFIREQGINLKSNVGEELRLQLLDEHMRYTQILLTVESHVGHYFKWDEWTIWLEDANGKTYFPRKTRESSNEQSTLAEDDSFMGRTTQTPGFIQYYDYGTLYFKKLDLALISPVTLVVADHKNENRFDFKFRVTGGISPRMADTQSRENNTDRPATTETNEIVPLSSEETMKLKKHHFKLATAYFKKENYQAAIHEWEKVLDLDPQHQISKDKIGRANKLLELKSTEEIPLSEDEKQKLKSIHFLMATEYFKSGSYEQAITEWKNVLELDPDHQLSKDKILKAEQILNPSPVPEPLPTE